MLLLRRGSEEEDRGGDQLTSTRTRTIGVSGAAATSPLARYAHRSLKLVMVMVWLCNWQLALGAAGQISPYE